MTMTTLSTRPFPHLAHPRPTGTSPIPPIAQPKLIERAFSIKPLIYFKQPGGLFFIARNISEIHKNLARPQRKCNAAGFIKEILCVVTYHCLDEATGRNTKWRFTVAEIAAQMPANLVSELATTCILFHTVPLPKKAHTQEQERLLLENPAYVLGRTTFYRKESA